ncbi:MAG: hypothetical protein LBQ54_06665 [Planctomycetaceae bacterium]|nr:hypothetical protein [Planctomycetaceae bacterium]
MMTKSRFIGPFPLCWICSFLLIASNLIFAGEVQDDGFPEKPETLVPDHLNWQEMTLPEEKAKIFSIISNNAEANYQKIKTWEASYKMGFHCCYKRSPYKKEKGVIVFAIDMINDNLNWFYHCEECFLYTPERPNLWIWESSPETASISGLHLIFRPESILCLNTLQTFSARVEEIPDYEIKDKKIARQISSQAIDRSPVSERSDPRFFFCFNKSNKWEKYWGEYLKIAHGLTGNDEELKGRLDRRYRVYQCLDQNNTWYSIEEYTTSRKSKLRKRTFSGTSGFNIVENTEYYPGDSTVLSLRQWNWKKSNNIFIPQKYNFYISPVNSLISYELLDSKLNSPIPLSRFTYEGLSLTEGDILLNDMEKKAYITKKNGKIVSLCNYGESPK